MRPPTLRVIPPAARLAGRAKHRVMVGLRSNNLLLNLRQQQFRFGQCQTQLGDLTEAIRPADLHHVETSRLTVSPGSNQT